MCLMESSHYSKDGDKDNKNNTKIKVLYLLVDNSMSDMEMGIVLII